jgi:hypothetical protein
MFASAPDSVREPFVIARCPSELWDGVRCTLPAGHKGSHLRRSTDEGCCELRWRSSLPCR